LLSASAIFRSRPAVDVNLFTSTEATTYLRARTGLRDDAGAAQVAEHLGQLPLALAQAAAVIGPGRRYPTYQTYLDRLAHVDVGELLPRASGDPYPHGAAEAVLLALDDLNTADPGGPARRLLDHLAVLAPTGADASLLRHLTADQPPQRPPQWQMRRQLRPGTGVPDVDAVVAILAERSLTMPTVEAGRTRRTPARATHPARTLPTPGPDR
jgi:hypothetical protein